MSGSAKFFLIALVLGLAMRAALIGAAFDRPEMLAHSDQQTYIQLADHLLAGGGFGESFGAERLPVYPAFLAASFRLADSMGLQDQGPALAVTLQNVIGLLSVPLLFAMGGLFSRHAANLAGGLAALNPNMAVYSSQILTEALFYPLFALALLLLFRYKASGDRARLFAAAFLFGVSTLIRPVTMFLPLFFIPYLLLEGSTQRWRSRLVNALAFTVLFLAALSPWLARNYVIYGHAGLTGQGVPHLVGWVLPAVSRYEEGMDLSAAMEMETRRWSRHAESLPDEVKQNPFALDREVKGYALERLLDSSLSSLTRAWFWGAVKNVFTPITVELAYILDMDWSHFYETRGKGALEQAYNFIVHNKNRTYSLMLAAGIVLTLALRLLQLYGACVTARVRPGILVSSLVVIAYFLAVNGPVGYAKYRLPFEPILVLMAALGLSALFFRDRAGSG